MANVILAMMLSFLSTNAQASLLYRGHLDSGYSQEITVYSSADFIPAQPYEVILHLHGFLRPKETYDDVLKEFQFDQMLEKSGRQQTLLVVPASREKCSDFNATFADCAHSDAFFDALARKLNSLVNIAPPIQMLISGHSGAYKSISMLLTHSAIRAEAVTLFDAIYGQEPAFAAFINAHPEVPFTSFFLTGTTTESENQKLFALLAPQKDFKKSVIDGDQTPQNIRPVNSTEAFEFIRSTYTDDNSHWNLVKKFFPLIYSKPL